MNLIEEIEPELRELLDGDVVDLAITVVCADGKGRYLYRLSDRAEPGDLSDLLVMLSRTVLESQLH